MTTSWLSKATHGKQPSNYFICLYGTIGVGKTTFGSEAPDPLFLLTEDGARRIKNGIKLPVAKDYQEVLSMLDEILLMKHDRKTLVVDSLDHLERLIWKEVCDEHRVPTIIEIKYGKGYGYAMQKWHLFFDRILKIKDSMNVILICHETVRIYNDPTVTQPYDRKEMKLHKDPLSFLREVVDAILLAAFEVQIVGEDRETRAKSSDKRVVYTEWRAAHDGKNRFGLPYKIDMGWENFTRMVEASDPDSRAAMISQIQGLVDSLTDATLKQKAQSELVASVDDPKKLVAIKKRLQEIIGEKI